MRQSKTAILLSGGLDSIALAYWKRPELAFTIDYGQNAADAELRASSVVAKALGVEHHIIKADCSSLGVGIMSQNELLENSPSTEWWPFRNQLIITLAAMCAIRLRVDELMVGTVKEDCQYLDGTVPFFDSINQLMANQEGGIRVNAPAINMSTEELIRVSGVPRDILLWAHSCNRDNIPCGTCPSCLKYKAVRACLGIY